MLVNQLSAAQYSLMPRRPRQIIPGIPLHLVQRGNDKQDCFLSPRDYRVYLNAVAEYSESYAVEIHAYVLMTNHVHMLVTPVDKIGISRMMQQIGRKYVSYFNDTHKRTGTLWEGRFKSSVVGSDKYLLACYRYIELNPVRAGLVAAPADYDWSSYRTNALGQSSDIVKPRREWIDLGFTQNERLTKYRLLFEGSEPF